MSESSKLPGPVGALLKPQVVVPAVLVSVVGALHFSGVAWSAIWVGLLVLVVAAALFFGGVYLARRRDKRAVDATISGMTDSITAKDDSPQARERVAKLRGKWERLFKNVRPDYVKKKPILMIVGESKSGKSVLLDRSGLELESGNRQERDWEEGTENVDPWFFPDGLVLDTAGEMVMSETGGARIDWTELIKLIKKLRPRSPVSGVILVVPVYRLESADANKRIEKANQIQRELQRLVHEFGVRFPVSVVVTMSDLIDGFTEFSLRQSAARPGDKYTILGWPQYQLADEFGAREVLGESIGGVISRVEAQVLYDTCNPDTASVEAREALEIWCFPRHLRRIGEGLTEYLRIVFKEKQSERVANAPFFRGVFFGSAMQPISRGEPRRKEPERPRSEPFNIRDLLAIRIFGEAGLVTTSPHAEAAVRNRFLIGLTVPIVVAVVAAAVAGIAFDLAGRVSQQKQGLETLATLVEKPAESAIVKADGKLAPEGERKALSEALVNARSFNLGELPFWLKWYGGFAKDRAESAKSAASLAWTRLVAMPVLERAREEKNWKDEGVSYRKASLKDLGGSDNELTSALRLVEATAGSVALKPAKAPRVDDASAQQGAAPREPDTLAPIYRAMAGELPADMPALLDIPDGWKPPASMRQAARDADKVRVGILADKFKAELAQLVAAADLHAAWVAPQRAASDAAAVTARWDDIKTRVWPVVEALKKSGDKPSARWLALSRLLGDAKGADELKKFLGRSDDVASKIAGLDELVDLPNIGEYVTDGDAIVERIGGIAKMVYAPGELAIPIGLAARNPPSAAADPKAAKEAHDRKLAYLKPLLDLFDESVAGFLGAKVTGGQPPKVGVPTQRGVGFLSPIFDLSKVEAGRTPENLDKDLKALSEWPGRDLHKTEFDRANSSLIRWRREAADQRSGWRVVKFEEDAGSFVARVLAADNAVETVRRFVEAQLKEKDPTRTESVSTSAHKALADALKALGGSKDGSRDGSTDRPTAIGTLASPPNDETRRKIEAALYIVDRTAVSGNPEGGGVTPEERDYWDPFWRSLLNDARAVREKTQKNADLRLKVASARFPLANPTNAGDVQDGRLYEDPETVVRVVRDDAPSAARGERGGRRVEVSERSALLDLWTYEPPREKLTQKDKRALELARILASDVLKVEDLSKVELRFSWKATGGGSNLPAEIKKATGREAITKFVNADAESWDNELQLRFTVDSKKNELRANQIVQGQERWDVTDAERPLRLTSGTLGERPNAIKPVDIRRGGWSPLALAALLETPDPNGLLLKDEKGYFWGACRVFASGGAAQDALYVYIGLKLEWVCPSDSGKPVESAIDVNKWLEGFRLISKE